MVVAVSLGRILWKVGEDEWEIYKALSEILFEGRDIITTDTPLRTS